MSQEVTVLSRTPHQTSPGCRTDCSRDGSRTLEFVSRTADSRTGGDRNPVIDGCQTLRSKSRYKFLNAVYMVTPTPVKSRNVSYVVDKLEDSEANCRLKAQGNANGEYGRKMMLCTKGRVAVI